jgi:hypothetical protein
MDQHEMNACRVLWQPALNDARDFMGGAKIRVEFVDRLPAGRYDFDGPGRPRKCLGQARGDGAGGFVIELLADLDEEQAAETFAHELAHVTSGHCSRLGEGTPNSVAEAEARHRAPSIMRRYGLW